MENENLTLGDQAQGAEEEPDLDGKPVESEVKKTRKDLHLPRRFFHMCGGLSVGSIYNYLLTHQQAVYILGTCACLIYIFEQIRVAYPEYASKYEMLTRYFYRAEERLKESAGVPMAMAYLLTILSFPKSIAIAAIFTLALADPLSAIIGIRFGKRHLVKEKTLEGSAAFFTATFTVVLMVLWSFNGQLSGAIWATALLTALLGSAFEMIPLRLDDNMTIPLFTAFILWIISGFLAVPTP